MKIVISPFSNLKAMSDGRPHPKNMPISYWKEIISSLKLHHEIIQIGVTGEERLTDDCRFDLKIPRLVELIKEMDLFISVDNFFPHMVHHYHERYKKRGIVIFSQSDPAIYSYIENANLLKDKKYLRKNQFWLWGQAEYNEDAFVHPEEVMKAINQPSATVAPIIHFSENAS